jgi:hypothetical protein
MWGTVKQATMLHGVLALCNIDFPIQFAAYMPCLLGAVPYCLAWLDPHWDIYMAHASIDQYWHSLQGSHWNGILRTNSGFHFEHDEDGKPVSSDKPAMPP